MYASQLLPFNLHFSHSFLPSGDDFTIEPLTITIPANRQSYTIETFFNISDDNLDEDEQSFAIVADIGPDVPDGVSCFQTEIRCLGRRGATKIRIADNDRKHFCSSSCHNFTTSNSYDHWIHRENSEGVRG